MRLLWSAKTFYGNHIRTLQIIRLGQTRPDGLAIEQHRACPALSLSVAGLLRAGEPQMVPEQIEQDTLIVLTHLQT